MTQYLQQLQDDQATLQLILKHRRESLAQLALDADDPLALKVARPSVRLLHQAYLFILEDALKVLKSLIEYFEPHPHPQPQTPAITQVESTTQAETVTIE